VRYIPYLLMPFVEKNKRGRERGVKINIKERRKEKK
jgi:hypothetical protein